MVRRSPHAEFVPDAHVFPGGAVDPADRGPRAERLCCGRSDAEASAILGVASGGLAYWVAAVRECFEEAGLLLACDESGAPADLSDPDVAERLARHRAQLNAREQAFLDICEMEGLRLSAGELAYVSHWITPEGSPRRYDTRFFAAAAPEGQTPAYDAGETVAHVWLRPAEALERHRSGEIDLILPTIRNLQAIGAFVTTAELFDAAAALRDVPAMLPRAVAGDDGPRLLVPGDPGYADAADADPRRADPRRADPRRPRAPVGREMDVEAAIRRASLEANASAADPAGADRAGADPACAHSLERGGRG